MMKTILLMIHQPHGQRTTVAGVMEFYCIQQGKGTVGMNKIQEASDRNRICGTQTLTRDSSFTSKRVA